MKRQERPLDLNDMKTVAQRLNETVGKFTNEENNQLWTYNVDTRKNKE